MIQIAKYDLEGNFLEILEAEKFHHIAVSENVDQTTLKRAVNNISLTANKFQYKPVDPNYKVPVKIGPVWDVTQGNKIVKHMGIIGKYYKNRLICTYESLTEMAEKNGIEDFTVISRKLAVNKSAIKGGFTFKKIS